MKNKTKTNLNELCQRLNDEEKPKVIELLKNKDPYAGKEINVVYEVQNMDGVDCILQKVEIKVSDSYTYRNEMLITNNNSSKLSKYLTKQGFKEKYKKELFRDSDTQNNTDYLDEVK